MKKKNSYFENIFIIVLTTILLVYFGHNNISIKLHNYSIYLYQILILFLTGICGFKIIHDKKVKIINKNYLTWLITFIFMTVLSIIWSIDGKYAYSAIVYLIFNFL